MGNIVAANGFNGLNIQESRAIIRGNQISDNGERGIGVQSFDGEITGNNFIKNRLYAIDLEGSQDVAATGNWWGGDDPAKVIFDKRADPSRGNVHHDKASALPFRFRLAADNCSGRFCLARRHCCDSNRLRSFPVWN